MRSFAIVLLATAVLAADVKEDPKKHDKRSLGGYVGYGLSSGLGDSTRLLGSGLSGISLGTNNLISAYNSGLGYGGAYGAYGTYGTHGTYGLGSPGVIVGGHSAGLGIGPVPSVAHARTERITGLTLHREVQVPVPVPHPVPVEVTKHVPVPQPVPVKVDRPYPVAVPQPVPVPVTRHVPVRVDRPYPVPVPQPVEVRVPQPVPVPVSQPIPVPVSVTRHVPISVPSVRVLPSVGIATSYGPGIPSGIATSYGPGIPSGIATSYGPGISSGISSGHEYVDLGSSSLGTISGATLGTGLDSGVVSGGFINSGVSSLGSGVEHIGIGSGVEHIGSGTTLLGSHGALDGGYAYSAPLKKW